MLNNDGITLRESASIADCLNSHFGSVGEKLASEFNYENNNGKDPLDYIQKQVHNSVFLPYTDDNKVLQILSKLDINKGYGYDLISNRILKGTSAVITPYSLFIQSLSSARCIPGFIQNC